MPDELKARPVEIAKLGLTTLAAATTVGDGQRAARVDLVVPAAAFGRVVAADVSESHRDLCATADTALQTLGQVYEGDVDNLYQTAASYQHADINTAGLLDKLNPLNWF
jgi:hypothetical protein